MKAIADAPLQSKGCSEGVGRFGPLSNGTLFINVSKKYNFDNLSQSDIETLIEDKLQKNIDKVLHNWEEGFLLKKHVGDALL
jgi:DNA topoisomerase-1